MQKISLMKRSLGLVCSLAWVSGCGDDGVAADTGSTSGTTGLQSSSSAPGTETTAETTPTSGTTGVSNETLGTGSETSGEPTSGTTSDPTTTGSTGGDPVCGDGVLDPGEACDNGPGNGPGEACSAECVENSCGDGDQGPGEACDDGAMNGNMNGCKADCTDNVCGDGFTGPDEGCDDGNQVDADECSNTCALATCGDGVVAATEACDDGNQENADACTNACTTATCGDAFVQAGETCDAGADNSDNTACTLDCQSNVCGDGKLFNTDPGTEVCDDGVDNGPGKSCNAMCLPNVCGDGDIGPGETCDDKNTMGGDGCSATCALEECGNKVIDPGETCDDGNLVSNDGCSATCTGESIGKVFLTSSNGSQGFYGYTIANNTWATLTNPPVPTYSQITNDGKVVYLLGNNNIIYQYNPLNNTWSASATPGPNAQLAAQPIGYFKWTNQGFFYVKDGSQTLYSYKNNVWSTTNLPAAGSSAGSWDKSKNELYIRTYGQLGFQVINTTTNAVVRNIVDAGGVGENSRTGSFSGGFFYTRDFTGPFQKYDAMVGTKTNTNQTPLSGHTATDTDVTTGLIYIAGYSGQANLFQRYSPANNTISSLANSALVDNHSTITVVIP